MVKKFSSAVYPSHQNCSVVAKVTSEYSLLSHITCGMLAGPNFKRSTAFVQKLVEAYCRSLAKTPLDAAMAMKTYIYFY